MNPASFRRYWVFIIFLMPVLLRAQIANLSADSLLQELSRHEIKDSTRVLLLNQLAYVNYYADPVACFRYGLEAKDLAEQLHYSRGQADACRQIGMAYSEQGNAPNALNYFLEGLRIAELNHHTQVEADITGNIGTAYNSMGNPREALTFLVKARHMQRRLMNYLRESAVLNNIGDSYLMMKQYQRAQEAYATAYDYSVHHNYKFGITTNYRNLGNVFEATGRYDSALAHYFKCLQLSEQINDHRGYILSHKSIASVYLKQKNIVQAEKHARIALDRALRSRLRSTVRDLYELIYKIAEIENNKQESFENFKLYVAYKDSVQNLRAQSEIAAQRLHFESGKKQAEIELLKKDGELLAESIAMKNIQLGFTIVLTLLFIVFSVFSVRSYLRTKHKNNLLVQKNEEVDQQQKQIKEQRDELIALNEELRSQREEIMTQRDSLAEKNKEVENMSKKVAEVNELLEQQVAQRTEVLENQNNKLSEYAFLNAHKLRAPLARIMGLVNLMQMKSDSKPVIMNHLANSSDELTDVVNSISKTIQEELNPKPKSDK